MIEIKKRESGKYSFDLKTQGGHTLLKSVDFTDQQEAQKIVKSLNQVRPNGIRFERKTNHDGKFLFNLKNSKGKLIGQSLLYNSEAGMENGITNLENTITSLANLGEL
ncbi:MAG: YegP family protein [Maribacter sp.]|nr:YegP family protein [Maribacter sp.]MBT8301986.1 YegP family protein [Maribacter sp.]NNK75157.1 YegP family protein [Maribacter sp.]